MLEKKRVTFCNGDPVIVQDRLLQVWSPVQIL